MSVQNNDESDFDFSIIDKKSTQEAKLNFSVESLLQEHEEKKNKLCQPQQESANQQQEIVQQNDGKSKEKCVNANGGSFLQDLEKLQDSLSFETQPYNVYHDQPSLINSLNPLTKSNINGKSNSNLKTTKQESKNISIDDYGYLVIDFGQIKKRKKSSKLEDLSKITSRNKKFYTQQRTLSSHKLKLSSTSSIALLGQSTKFKVAEQSQQRKSKTKSVQSIQLHKLLSPPKIPKEKSVSKQKTAIKGIRMKQKTQTKQTLMTRTQKYPCFINSIKSLSKSKSPSKTLSSLKSIRISKNNSITTAVQSARASNKSYTKSSNKQGNVYSDYYGFEEEGDSQRLVMKSNCVHKKGQKTMRSPQNMKKAQVIGNNLNVTGLKSKQKCKKMVRSPSPSINKDLTSRFKKKKTVQNV